MKTTVVHIRDKQEGDVYIGRPGKGETGYFGNPIKLSPVDTRGSTIEKYRTYFLERLEADPEFKRRVLELKGKRLVCFCAPARCHGDVIAEYLNEVNA